MVRTCCFLGCKNDTRKLKKTNTSNVSFLAFPKPHKNYDKCLRWIAVCRPGEDSADFITKITANTHVCSQHFIGGKGPTYKHPDPVSRLSDFQVTGSATNLSEIIMPRGWMVERGEEDSYTYYKKRNQSIILQCTVDKEYYYKIKINGHPAPNELLEKLPSLHTLRDVALMLDGLNQLIICIGNPEEDLVKAYMKSKSSNGRYHEETKTVFSINCKQSSEHKRCMECLKYRHSLRTIAMRMKNKPTSIKNMTKKQLIAKVKLANTRRKREVLNLMKRISKLKKKQEEDGSTTFELTF